MNKIFLVLISIFVVACAAQNTMESKSNDMLSDSQNYEIIETRTIMNVKLSFTDIANKNAKKEGKTLNAAIQSITPFLYLALTSAASNTNNFEAYIIDRLHMDTKKGMDVAAIVIDGEYIDLAYPKKNQVEIIAQFMNNLGKDPNIRVSKAKKRGITITM